MPEDAPAAKLAAVEGYGAEITTYDRYSKPQVEAGREFAAATGMTFVPAYDDPRIAAGAGTAALELLEDAGPLDVLVAPIGGGGGMSGYATVVKALHPDARVIGVEAAASAVTKRSLEAGERIRIPVPRHLADGQMLTQPGEWTFEVMRRLVDEIVLVSDDEILAAMAFLFDRLKLVTEPSGAIATAALLAGHVDPAGRRVGAIVSGGNVGLERFMSLMAGVRAPGVAGSRRASSVRERTPSLRYARVRFASTVRSETNSSPAISRFDRPPAASSAIRSSLVVSSSRSAVRRPPTRAVSARARSAQPSAPSASNSRSAVVSDSRAALRCRARRWTEPSASRARASSNGPPDSSWARTASPSWWSATSVSPSAALSSPRQRCAAARSHGHRAPASSSSRSSRAVAGSPSAIAASIASGCTGTTPSSPTRRAHEDEDGLECGPRLRMAPERELEDAERPAVLGLREAVFGALGDRETLVEGSAGRLRAAEVGERQALGEQQHRPLGHLARSALRRSGRAVRRRGPPGSGRRATRARRERTAGWC